MSWWAQRNPTWAREHHPEWKESLRQVKEPTHLQRPAELENRRLANEPNRDRDRPRPEPAAVRTDVRLDAHERGHAKQFHTLERQRTEGYRVERANNAQWEQVEPEHEAPTLDQRHQDEMSSNARRRWEEDRHASRQHWAQQASVARDRQMEHPDFNRRPPDTFARERTAPSFHQSSSPTHFGNGGGSPLHGHEHR